MYSILVRSYFQNSKHLFRLYQAPKTNAYNASEKPDKTTYIGTTCMQNTRAAACFMLTWYKIFILITH